MQGQSDTVLRKDVKDIVLDFSHVQALTGASLGKLVRWHNQLKQIGNRLVLQNVNDDVREILEVTGLINVLYVMPRATPTTPITTILPARRVSAIAQAR